MGKIMKKNFKKIIILTLLAFVLILVLFCIYLVDRTEKFKEQEQKEYIAEYLNDTDTQILGNEIGIDFSSCVVTTVKYSLAEGLIVELDVGNLSSFLKNNMEDLVSYDKVNDLLRNGYRKNIPNNYIKDNYLSPNGKFFEQSFYFVKSESSDFAEVTVVYDDEEDKYCTIIRTEKINDKILGLLKIQG